MRVLTRLTILLLFSSVFIFNSCAIDEDCTADESISNLTASDSYSDKVELNWDGVSGATWYQLEKKENPADSYAEISSSDKEKSYFTDLNVESDSTYYYRITAKKDSDNCSKPTEVTGFTAAP